MLPGAWLVIVTGILSIIFALVVALNPGLGVQVLTQVFGIYAVIAGALLFGFALHLRGLQKPNGHGTWVSKGLGCFAGLLKAVFRDLADLRDQRVRPAGVDRQVLKSLE